jgi:anti-anti-sigma factor
MSSATINFEQLILADASKKAVMVTILGQIDETSADEIAEKFYAAIEEVDNGTNFLLDFQGMNFINSKGIGYLLDFFRRVSAKGGKLIIARPPENVLDILELVGVTKVLEVFFTVEEAKLAI